MRLKRVEISYLQLISGITDFLLVSYVVAKNLTSKYLDPDAANFPRDCRGRQQEGGEKHGLAFILHTVDNDGVTNIGNEEGSAIKMK